MFGRDDKKKFEEEIAKKIERREAELAQCQRYFEKEGESNVRAFPIGRSEKVTPVVSMSDQVAATVNQIVASGNYLRQHEKEISENQKVLARIAYARFLAFKEAGFSHDDALRLCTQA